MCESVLYERRNVEASGSRHFAISAKGCYKLSVTAIFGFYWLLAKFRYNTEKRKVGIPVS